MNKLRIFNVLWSSKNGGPSPDDDIRTEIFLSGCNKAISGEPCKGCFNYELWDPDRYVAEVTPLEAFEKIERFSPNKYITFVGGEPLDQVGPLAELCKLLKAKDYHIIVFTHFKLDTFQGISEREELLKYIDILIDGEYDIKEHLPNKDIDTAFNNSIGSGNQVVWDIHTWNNSQHAICAGFYARDIVDMHIKDNNELIFIYKDDAKQCYYYPA